MFLGHVPPWGRPGRPGASLDVGQDDTSKPLGEDGLACRLAKDWTKGPEEKGRT